MKNLHRGRIRRPSPAARQSISRPPASKTGDSPAGPGGVFATCGTNGRPAGARSRPPPATPGASVRSPVSARRRGPEGRDRRSRLPRTGTGRPPGRPPDVSTPRGAP